jgi:crossover junction endodeoxyribonuclease RusA
VEARLMLELDLPFPPSVNHYWRHVGPRTLISRQGREYRETVCALLARRRLTPLEGRLAVHVEAFPPDRRRRDVDNLCKSLLDALGHGGAYRDDSQIDWLSLEKCEPVSGGRTKVSIFEEQPGHEGETFSPRARLLRWLWSRYDSVAGRCA